MEASLIMRIVKFKVEYVHVPTLVLAPVEAIDLSLDYNWLGVVPACTVLRRFRQWIG